MDTNRLIFHPGDKSFIADSKTWMEKRNLLCLLLVERGHQPPRPFALPMPEQSSVYISAESLELHFDHRPQR